MEPKHVQEKYDKAVQTISATVRDYWLNTAFHSGHQWVYFNPQSHRLDTWEGDPERVKAVVNRIWPASRTTQAKLTQRELTFDVSPSAPDDATMHGASTAEAILHDVHLRHSWEDIRSKNSRSTWLGGTAAICVDWDPKAGNQVDQDVFEGDTVETPLSIAEFVVEPGSRDPIHARWWIKAQSLPPEQVKATYNLEDTPPADATAGLSPLQGSLMAGNDGREGQRPELTKVLTYYERPNNASKKGCVCVVIDGKMVQGPKDWPFPFKDRLNLAITYETQKDTTWDGETVVTMARPIQVLYNQAQSNIAEHIKNAGNARLAVPSSMIDLMQSFSDLPGEMIPFNEGDGVPSWISPPQMPNWWETWPSKLEVVMDDLMGVHDVSRGTAPTNIESGYGLSVLAEHDSTPIGRMLKSAAVAWSDVATMVLQLYSSEVKETRTSMVATPGFAPETVRWTGRELQGQTQAVVPEDAIVPISKAAAMATADKMMQMGLITTIEEYATQASLPGQRHLLERTRPDAAKARRENADMAVGMVAVPADFDDHAIHIAEHNVFRKSAKYERSKPEVRGIIDTHIQAHETMAAELAGKSRQAAAIDPMLATAPTGDSRPTITPDMLPPESLSMAAPGADDPFLAEDPAMELQDLAAAAASV